MFNIPRAGAFATAILMLGGSSVWATAETPRNMIFNSNMYSSGINGEFPDGWSAVYHMNMPEWKQSADGKSRTAIFVNNTDRRMNSDIRAFSSLYIEPGEKYRFRLKIRTRNFTAGRLSFVAFAPGWNGSFGIEKTLPENTDWITLDEVCTASTGRGNIYSFAIHFSGFKGEVEVANPEVLPESEKAVAGARYVRDEFPVQPLKPLLNKVERSDDITLTFRNYSKQPEVISYSCNNGAAAQAAVDKNGNYQLKLGKLPLGKHTLNIQINSRSEKFDFTVVEPQKKAVMGEKLNNFHWRIGSWNLKNAAQQKFVLPHAGVVRFFMPENCSVTIEGKNVICRNQEDCFLPPGEHSFTVSSSKDVQISASLLAETLLYPLANGPLNLTGLKALDYQHVQKHIFPAYSAFVAYGDHITRQQVKEMIQAGHNRMYGSVSMAAASKLPLTGNAASEYFNERNSNEFACNVTIIDEIENNIPFQTQHFSDLFKNMKDLKAGSSVHIWLCGGVVYPEAFTAAFLQNTAAASDNMLHHYEIYTAPERNEKASRQVMNKKFRALTELLKMSPDTIGVTLSHCNLPFSYSMDIYPHVNFKYFLDMQLHELANNPAYSNLKAVGFWADHYADKESSRFAADLLRHYVKEGRKEMFTKQFGYNFAPGHIKNPDFENGMADWNVKGKVKSVTADLFGLNWQRRISVVSVGDSFAEFTRGKTANTISQRAQGLIPGKIYSLTFINGDAVRLRQRDHRKGEISCTIEGVKILPEYSERSIRNEKSKGNFDKIVFVAQCSNPLITFSDEKCPEGLRSYLNFVSLMPYYTGTEADKK